MGNEKRKCLDDSDLIIKNNVFYSKYKYYIYNILNIIHFYLC